MAKLERFFPADHPSAQGHFPGNPIIPGAVLLSETLQAIGASLGVDLSPCRIHSAKFLHPVRPGDRVLIDFMRVTPDAIRFACAVGGQNVLTGQVQCIAPQAAT